MATVYSTRFIGANTATRRQLDYTVPDGYRAVVRSISFWNSSSGIADASVFVAGTCYLWFAHQVPANGFAGVEMNQVLNAGELLIAAQSAGSGFFMVSGFLLSELPPA